MHPAPNDGPEQIPVADSSKKTSRNVVFSRLHFSENVSKCASRQTHGLYAPGLALLRSTRLAAASLALPALATTAAALRAARRPGCCCEVQARRARPIRGEVGKARQGQVRQPGLPWPWAHSLALGPLYGGPLGALGPMGCSWGSYRPQITLKNSSAYGSKVEVCDDLKECL